MKKYLISYQQPRFSFFTIFSKASSLFPRKYLLFFFLINLSLTSIRGQDTIAIIQQLESIDWEREPAFDVFNEKMEEGIKILSEATIIQFYKVALKKAEEVNNLDFAFYYSGKLNFYYEESLNDTEKALEYAKIMLRYAQQLDNKREIVAAFMRISQAYVYQDKLPAAIDNYFKAIAISEEAKLYESAKSIYTNIAYCYAKMGQIEEAVIIIKNSIKEMEEDSSIHKNYFIVSDLAFITKCYQQLEQTDSSRFYVEKLRNYLPLLKSDTSFQTYFEDYGYALGEGYIEVTNFYLSQQELELASKYYKNFKALKTVNNINIYLLDVHYALQSGNLLKTGQLIENPPPIVKTAPNVTYFKYASKYYNQIGNYQQSLAFYKQLKEEEIIGLKSNTIKYTEYTNIKLDNAEKEQALLQLKNDQIAQEKRTQLFLISLISALLLLFLLAYLYAQIKKRNSLLNEDLKNQALIEQQAKKLQLADEQKTKLFVNIAHELRTPLSIINGLSNQLKGRNVQKEQQQTYLNIISNNGEQLSEQVNQILELSQLDNYKPILNNQFFYLNELVEQLTVELQYKASTKKIQLVFEEKAEPQLLKADVEKLKTILKNLIVNAINHSLTQGLVVISLVDKAEVGYEVKIKDFGKGIPAEDIPHLFDRYFQSNQPKSRGGFGIGLSICKEYIDLLGGKIHIESKLGLGSIFTVFIPKNFSNASIEEINILQLNSIVATKNEIEVLTPLSLAKSKEKSILIVEDNRDFYIYLESLLSPHFNLFYVQNGAEAIQYLKENQPDLVLTDWMMPEKDGMELIGHLKAHIAYQQTPIIVLSARSLVSDQLKAINLGAVDYILKTAKGAVILEKITKLLKKGEERESVTIRTVESFEFYQKSKNKFLKLNETDQSWLLRLEQIIRLNLSNYDLSLTTISEALEISISQLNRKVKKIIGLTTMNYIQELRYWEARRMLEEKEVESVKVVCLSVGFKDIKNFSRNFKARFKAYPSEYLR